MHVLLTHARQYAGPGIVPVLLREGARVFCHDPSFADAAEARRFGSEHPGAAALAGETAPDGIQVNVVAPSFLYSEAYYPRARFVDDPAGRGAIAARVPLGRLGRPEAIGELVAFLVSGHSAFVTGQVIDFTGGWP